jgi:hypothetical protein
MVPERPLTAFLSWLIEDPHRLEGYNSREGFHELVERWEFELPAQGQEILDTNDLGRVLEAIRQETGDTDSAAVMMKWPEAPSPPDIEVPPSGR